MTLGLEVITLFPRELRLQHGLFRQENRTIQPVSAKATQLPSFARLQNLRHPRKPWLQ